MPVGPPVDVAFFATPEEMRAWFERNAETAPELWVGFQRKKSGSQSITWPQAVDEALCYGWIDSVRKGIDDQRYANRFTPRRAGSNWSAVNVARVADLTAQGRMQAAGLAAFALRRDSRTAIYMYENPELGRELTPDELDRLRANPDAWAYWSARPAGYRKHAAWWVNSAKQPATRERRLETLIADCAAGRLIKHLSYGRDSPPR